MLALVRVGMVFRSGEIDLPVLRGIDLSVAAGEFVVVLGPSGSGKSTLLNIVGGIERPTSGQVLFRGADLASMTDRELTAFRRANVGFVFQLYNLVPTLTALENVTVATEIADDPMDPAEALELVGLADRGHHFPAQLSGGEQQRVAIARAIAKHPTILLCDEPTGALDLEIGREVLDVLDRLHRDTNATVLLVTHNNAIAAMAERTIRLGSGRIERDERNPAPVRAAEVTW